MKKVQPSTWVVSLALLAASLLAFGISIPWLGLYADDWPFVYVNHLGGLRGVVAFISWVRPVAAWVFGGVAALVGTHFWLYHTLLMLLRWADSVLFYRMMRRAFPENPGLAIWSALLFVVFPAFKQQPLALEYFPHFIALALLFLSLTATLRLVQDPPVRRSTALLLGGLAWAGAFQVFIIEYFAGLEALRPVLVFLVLARCMDWQSAAKRALRLWLPFLPVIAAFLVWRVAVVGFPSYQPELVNGFGSSPVTALVGLAKNIITDVWMAGALTWLQPFTMLPAGGRTLLVWGALVAVSFLSALGFLWIYRSASPERSQVDYSWWARSTPAYVILGLIGMLCAGWPFWITRIPLSLDFPWDRTSLAFMVGACLLAAGALGLLELLVEKITSARLAAPLKLVFPNLLLAAILGASVGLHFQNGNNFRKEWSVLTPFYWQLAWRAPGLAPGSAIVLDQPPFNYHVDKFLSPLVNWTYAPESHSTQTPYTLLDFHKLWGKTLPPQSSADPIATTYGTLAFQGDTAHLLIVVYDPPGCLRVLTPPQETHLLISDELKSTLPLTNLALINPAPAAAAQPPAFLGPEPAHEWCYYFEKVELANQAGDLASAVKLADEAQGKNLSARQPSEYLALVYAYAHAGRWEDAQRLTQTVVSGGDFYRRAACSTWQQIGAEVTGSPADQVRAETGCP